MKLAFVSKIISAFCFKSDSCGFKLFPINLLRLGFTNEVYTSFVSATDPLKSKICQRYANTGSFSNLETGPSTHFSNKNF